MDAYMQRLLETSATPVKALRGFLILLHGHADESLIQEECETLHKKAGLAPLPEDATLLEGFEDLLKTHALAKEKQRTAAQGDQTQSSPIKP